MNYCCFFRFDALQTDEYHPPTSKRDGYNGWVEKYGFDSIMEEGADYKRRYHRDKDPCPRGEAFFECCIAVRYQSAPVYKRNSKDCPQLNDYVKFGRETLRKRYELVRENQVTGGGNRQEFRDTLNNSKNKRFNQFRHAILIV